MNAMYEAIMFIFSNMLRHTLSIEILVASVQ